MAMYKVYFAKKIKYIYHFYAVVNGIPHPQGMWGFEGEIRSKSYCFPGAVASYSRENDEDF